MKLLIDNIILLPGEDPETIKTKLNNLYDIKVDDIKIIRRSLDARKKYDIVYRYRIAIEIYDKDAAEKLLNHPEISEYKPAEVNRHPYHKINKKIVIIGAGPAGLFSALRLLETGARVHIFERGKPVEERFRDIDILENEGILNTESNVLFGEGGAGAYSDGKLTTRTNRPEIAWFYEKLIEHGAPREIMYDSRPHIGTDRLRNIVKKIRNKILDAGGEISFNEKITGITVKNSRVTGVVTSAGNEYPCEVLVLAAGHSARDTYKMLSDHGVLLQKKGFAVGSRIEHPAEIINYIQYGDSRYRKILPAADYSLAWNNSETGRGTYSFCMCPGGAVINASSIDGMLNTNGMSHSARDSLFSNSAIVVTVSEDDVEGDDPLSGIRFQENIERAAFRSGGGSFLAPAQRVTSFLKGGRDVSLPPVSYARGVTPSKLEDYLPSRITGEIKKALYYFDKRMKGFITSEAVFMGAETRTSSPVRIVRGKNFQSVSIEGLYPAGEGSGYSGGIVSSAVDGVRVADAIVLVSG